jgi:integrase
MQQSGVKMFKTQQMYHDKMKLEHRCFKKYINSLNSVLAQQSYGYHIQKFMRFCVATKYITGDEEFEQLLEFGPDKITDVLEDFVESLQEVNYKNVSTALSSPELFFTMNRKIWHNKLVRKGIRQLDRVRGGSLPITDEEIEQVYLNCKRPRDRFLISFLGCTGIRTGAIIDPIIKFKHLTPIDDCYGLRIYDESREGYWAILIPEASKDLDAYKQHRIKNGEVITGESPLFATESSRWNPKYDYLTQRTLTATLERRIKGHVNRIKTERDFDKAITYMFRKRFNTKLKLNNKVNSDVAELCMGHKLLGSQHTYTKPTLEQIYTAIKPAFESLTIDSNARKQVILTAQRKELEELKNITEGKIQDMITKTLSRDVK